MKENFDAIMAYLNLENQDSFLATDLYVCMMLMPYVPIFKILKLMGAEFELAKNLESQLEAATEKPAGPVGDVGVEDLFDPQLLSALREVGIESAVTQSPPEKTQPIKTTPVVNKVQAEPVKAKAVVNKTDTTNKDITELEEQIKAEKVKAVQLKRAGKQAEALDALRRAKLLEKKLNT